MNKEQAQKQCPFCFGTGRLEVECCDGSHGCNCGGGLVDVGECQVCNGSGYVKGANYDKDANYRYLRGSGACFAGSGATSGFFAGSKSLNGIPISEENK